jgi:hypothetical protein
MQLALIRSPLACLANVASKYRWRLRSTLQHYAVAWRYARGRSTPADGLSLLYDAEHIAGIHGLVSLSLDSVIGRARELYGDVPGLDDWAAEAVDRVASKHDGDGGEMVSAAEDWALEILEEYAARDGVNLRAAD